MSNWQWQFSGGKIVPQQRKAAFRNSSHMQATFHFVIFLNPFIHKFEATIGSCHCHLSVVGGVDSALHGHKKWFRPRTVLQGNLHRGRRSQVALWGQSLAVPHGSGVSTSILGFSLVKRDAS